MSINFRHAAAFALVGWYLMIPPGKEFMAPLGYWVQEVSFDTAKECASGQTAYSNEYGLNAIGGILGLRQHPCRNVR